MCGSTSAVGLEERERELWVEVKEQLREPGQLNGLMRGVLGNEEVAVVVAIEPVGLVRPLAVLVTPAIGEELVLPELTLAGPGPVDAYAVSTRSGCGWASTITVVRRSQSRSRRGCVNISCSTHADSGTRPGTGEADHPRMPTSGRPRAFAWRTRSTPGRSP